MNKFMKWIDFIMFIMIDALLLAYVVAAIAGVVPPAPEYAKMFFLAIVILLIVGTRITYNEAKNDK